MEKDIDLSGVEPARWPEIRRRVAILDEFVAIHRAPKAVRAAFASRMGISESQFMMLARVWRTSRRAADIPGARSRNAIPTARRIPARSFEIMREAIADLGAMARRKVVLAETVARCRRERVEPPSNSTIANMLAEARAAMEAETSFAPEILIDECIVKLPVLTGTSVTMPRVLLAVALPQRRILAAKISCDPNKPPSLAGLIDALKENSTPDGAPLQMRAPHRSGVERSAIGAVPREDGHGMPTLGRVLGPRIGDLAVIYQVGKARLSETLVAARHATAIGDDDAVRAIEDAIEAHNAQVPSLPESGFSITRRAGRTRRAVATPTPKSIAEDQPPGTTIRGR